METNSHLENIMKRPIRYWYEDGLGELITGMIFLFVGGYMLVQGLVENGLLQAIFGILSMIIIGGSPFIGRYLIRKIKERVVYPRTGYVKYSVTVSTGRIISIIIAALVTVGLVVMVAFFSEVLYWLPLIEGVVVGGLLLYQASQIGMVRLYIEVVASIILGAGISITEFGNTIGSGLYFSSFGLVLLIAGGVALIRYLRRTSALSGDE